MPGTPILVYDGPCSLCNRTAQWVFKKDRCERILFTSLQSNWAQKHLPEEIRYIDSVLYFNGKHWYTKSDAILNLMRELPRPWSWCFIFRIIPSVIRNLGYSLIAKSRFRLFGTGYCALLPEERVLD